MEVTLPKFQEECSAKIPALMLLNNLGRSFLFPEEDLSARNGKTSKVLLRDVLREDAQASLCFCGEGAHFFRTGD